VCSVTLLAIHAASEHEAGGGGSSQKRPHTPVQPDEVVRGSPPPDEEPSASVQREEPSSGVWALVAVCHPSQGGWRQVLHREPASLAPSDTVCLMAQARGRKLVTEDSKPVGSGEPIYRA
jgi:hypothetical protein